MAKKHSGGIGGRIAKQQYIDGKASFLLFFTVLNGSVCYVHMEQEEFMADPQQLLSEAQKEPRHRGLQDYRETIRVLREEKGFSLREIAAWLRERGLDVDHNAVWRTCPKGTPAGSGGSTSERNERPTPYRSHDEAMTWLGES